MTRELQTQNLTSWELPVAPDFETQQLLASSPDNLLKIAFKDNPHSVFLLKGTGFLMDMQILRWMDKYRRAIEDNTDLDLTKREFIDETVQDVIGVYFEYFTRQDIFPIHVDIRDDGNGQKTVYASKYNEPLTKLNQNLKDLTGQEEREGALAIGVEKAVEFITESGPDTVVILNSTKGWSGLKANGKEINYPDNQTYVYWINHEGDLEAITIRTKINLEAGEKLVKVESDTEVTTKERIKKVVSSPIRHQGFDFEQVLDLLEEASGQTLSKQRAEIRNRKNLFTLNDKAAGIVNSLKRDLLENISHLSLDNIRVFVETTGEAVLALAKLTLPHAPVRHIQVHYANGIGYQHLQKEAEYYAVYEQFQAIPGCAGGGKETGNNILKSRFGFAQMQVESHEMSVCKKCGTTVGVACGWCKPCWKMYGNSS